MIQTAISLFIGCAIGLAIGWWIQGAIGKRQASELILGARKKLNDVAGARDGFAEENSRCRTEIEQLRDTNAKHVARLESAIEKSKLLANSVLTLRSEREATKIKVAKIQKAFVLLRQQTAALQTEFSKSRDFYKRELMKALSRRKDLEKEVEDARAGEKSFMRQVESSVLEHGSAEDMLVAAQLRLGQLEVLERNVSKLGAENERLRQDARDLKLALAARERDLTKLEELRLHNKQLVRCVEALEDSRKAHEVEAEQYRAQADESEKLSDTLRLRLDDLQNNFAEMGEQQDQAIQDAREATVVPILRNHG